MIFQRSTLQLAVARGAGADYLVCFCGDETKSERSESDGLVGNLSKEGYTAINGVAGGKPGTKGNSIEGANGMVSIDTKVFEGGADGVSFGGKEMKPRFGYGAVGYASKKKEAVVVNGFAGGKPGSKGNSVGGVNGMVRIFAIRLAIIPFLICCCSDLVLAIDDQAIAESFSLEKASMLGNAGESEPNGGHAKMLAVSDDIKIEGHHPPSSLIKAEATLKSFQPFLRASGEAIDMSNGMCIATGKKCGKKQNPRGHPCCNNGICILKSDGKYCESEVTQTCIGTGHICGKLANPSRLPCCNGGDCVSNNGGSKFCKSPTCVGSGQFCGLRVNPNGSPCCDDTHGCKQGDGGKFCLPICIASEQRCGSAENPDELPCCDDHHTCQLVSGKGKFCKPRSCIGNKERCGSVENPDNLPCCNGSCQLQPGKGKFCLRDDRSQCNAQTGDTCTSSSNCCDKNDQCGYYGGFNRKICSPPCIQNRQRCDSASNRNNLPCCIHETRTHIFQDQQCLPDPNYEPGKRICEASYIKPFARCDDEANPGQKECLTGYGCYRNFPLTTGTEKYCLRRQGPVDSETYHTSCQYSDPLDKFHGSVICGSTTTSMCLYPDHQSSIPGTMKCHKGYDLRMCEQFEGKLCMNLKEKCRERCDSTSGGTWMCYTPFDNGCLRKDDADFDRDEISFDDFCRNMGGTDCVA